MNRCLNVGVAGGIIAHGYRREHCDVRTDFPEVPARPLNALSWLHPFPRVEQFNSVDVSLC